MQEFIAAIESALSAETGLESGSFHLESPRNPDLGDFAFPCFLLAKRDKANPAQVAGKLAEALNARLAGIQAVATGPYLNFKVDRDALAQSVVGGIRTAGATYGDSDEGKGKTVVIDLSSPNIAKPMSVGHLRSTVIGAAIQRLHDALGYETVGINHIGDWGSQFGKLVAAVDRWGNTVDLEGDPIRSLLALYVRYHEEEENDPELQAAGRAAFQELESGVDGHVRQVWRKLTELSMEEFNRTYARLNVTFDEIRGEAFYEDVLAPTSERIEKAGITEQSEGALIVSLTGTRRACRLACCASPTAPRCTPHATRPRSLPLGPLPLSPLLYVVGGTTSACTSADQVRAAARGPRLGTAGRTRRLRHDALAPGQDEHAQGPGRLPRRRARPRRRRSRQDHRREEPRPPRRRRHRGQVGVGAVIFSDLNTGRLKDIEFVWSEVLSFEGDTGPMCSTRTRASAASCKRPTRAPSPSPPTGPPSPNPAPCWSNSAVPAVIRQSLEQSRTLGSHPVPARPRPRDELLDRRQPRTRPRSPHHRRPPATRRRRPHRARAWTWLARRGSAGVDVGPAFAAPGSTASTARGRACEQQSPLRLGQQAVDPGSQVLGSARPGCFLACRRPSTPRRIPPFAQDRKLLRFRPNPAFGSVSLPEPFKPEQRQSATAGSGRTGRPIAGPGHVDPCKAVRGFQCKPSIVDFCTDCASPDPLRQQERLRLGVPAEGSGCNTRALADSVAQADA
ncbi:MAG: arginine--tRNA ligase [Planctomycetota bacterium]